MKSTIKHKTLKHDNEKLKVDKCEDLKQNINSNASSLVKEHLENKSNISIHCIVASIFHSDYTKSQTNSSHINNSQNQPN
jgi:hypothetical protein